jgi:hypothetical protein
MKIEQIKWEETDGWNVTNSEPILSDANLVLAFGGRTVLENKERFNEIKLFYPNSNILCCSTSGEIMDTQVHDNTIVVTAIHFEHTELRVSSTEVYSLESSYATGKSIADSFPKEELLHLFVISDGQKVNGSELVRGMNDGLPVNVTVTGGLAGDGSRFQKTLVGLNNYPAEGKIVAVGFYGKNLIVNYGSIGGWDSFGPDRLITKSKNNILYELDGQSALELYKKYLGDQAVGLPGTALLFPLSIKLSDGEQPVVRTILSIDEENKSMIFAGDMPEGSYARLMKANFERLIEGASSAATNTIESDKGVSPELAILISCVGRKLVLGQRIEEEVEGVREVLGDRTILSGFYSYGEISPFNTAAKCELHNQTMTITTFTER